jgi:cellulase/cellobiase CelA1
VILGGAAHAATTSPPSCAASYHTLNEAQAGFVAQVSVTNTGSSAVNGWSVTFTFGGHQQVTASWNATVQQSGETLTAVNASWDATIPVGGSIYGFGLYGTWWGSDAPPASLTCVAS